jgi:hypothetical protein
MPGGLSARGQVFLAGLQATGELLGIEAGHHEPMARRRRDQAIQFGVRRIERI